MEATDAAQAEQGAKCGGGSPNADEQPPAPALVSLSTASEDDLTHHHVVEANVEVHQPPASAQHTNKAAVARPPLSAASSVSSCDSWHKRSCQGSCRGSTKAAAPAETDPSVSSDILCLDDCCVCTICDTCGSGEGAAAAAAEAAEAALADDGGTVTGSAYPSSSKVLPLLRPKHG